MQYGQRKLHRSMTEMRKSCSGRPSGRAGVADHEDDERWNSLHLPAVHGGDEAFRVGIGTRRKLDEAVGAGKTREITRTVGGRGFAQGRPQSSCSTTMGKKNASGGWTLTGAAKARPLEGPRLVPMAEAMAGMT